ncbi:3-dehydroquinate dehydratase [Lactococcus hodotermopsidis]|uniref:3-dehydroquinate dehydratase n=1 Tax=Pseudolactococcus hodotermopsidis TaxID=2709157 RepID=A0A6A0BEG5_9LACT|nr:type I 3-dehydroquinate dehydratase [Lactococcus hodotermopsidis]GFH43075.1 3-dehydroquinate dehydratase [Lactococcus hodotermopsidis]
MKIVVPIMPRSLIELSELEESKFIQADMIEWRADFMPFSDLEMAAREVKKKFNKKEIIFTYRTEDKSEIIISKENYAKIIATFASEFDYIDIEKFTFPEIVLPENAIFSYHDFEKIPENLSDILTEMVVAMPKIVKFAGMPQNFADVLRLMSETITMSEKYETQTFVTMAMGEIGKITRFMGDEFGSSWTFATVETASAPGQLALSDILSIRKIIN